MYSKTICILLLSQLHFYTCLDTKFIFENINKIVVKFNREAAKLAWDSSITPGNPELPGKAAIFQRKLIKWQEKTCDQLLELSMNDKLNNNQTRQIYLLCRGPRLTFQETRKVSDLIEELQSIYSDAKICIPITKNIKTSAKSNLTEIEAAILDYLSKLEEISNMETFERATKVDPMYYAAKKTIILTKEEEEYDQHNGGYFCFYGEEDINKLMAFSRNERVLKWLWLIWRDKVGPPMKEPYKNLVELENRGARRNGYTDIGASWRDELEIPDLRNLCRDLYADIKPLYELLHGVARFFLRQRYGHVVMERGPIPAHLLGDLWSMNWEPLAELILPKTMDLDGRIKSMLWTSMHMAKRAEDFYQSLGLPPMTPTFWRESVFSKNNHPNMRCHGTAADMFKSGDYRLLYCSGTSMDNFYVLHHEMGHIQYYMAYTHQPGIFRQANSALQETIGDAIMYGVNAPQHLNRLGLINESILYENGDQKYINRLPNYEKEPPNYEKGSPNYEIEPQHHKKDPPNYEKEPQQYEKDPPNYEKVPQHYEKDPPNYEKEPQHHKKDPPNYEKEPQHYEKDPPNYEKEPQHYEKDPPNYEKIPPKYEKERTFIQPIDDEGSFEIETIKSNHQSKENLFSANDVLILKTALNKIPQIPFGLLIEEYRWKYFEGSMREDEWNKQFWDLALELQGISPPVKRSENDFDIGAKFHVADNTPYIRYFLSSFLQHQLFEKLCIAAVFGRRNVADDLPYSIPLMRCDIYGSKAAGKLLKDLMSRGHSQHWREILSSTIGEDQVSSKALKRYYRPLYSLLERLVKEHRIPIGW